MDESGSLHPVEFIDNYFPVIDGVTETVHEYALHMNATVVCPAMESRYLEKHDFPYPVLTALTARADREARTRAWKTCSTPCG